MGDAALPEGFQLDEDESEGLPEGFTVDAPASPQQQPQRSEGRLFANIAEGGVRGVFDNAMKLPDALGEVVGTGLAGATGLAHTLGQTALQNTPRTAGTVSRNFDLTTGEPLTFRENLSRNYQTARNTWPASTLTRGYNAPTSLDVQALAPVAAQAAYQYRTPDEYDQDWMQDAGSPEREMTDLGQMFTQERDEILEGVLQRRAAHPIGAKGGDVLSDILTVVSGRAPIVNSRRLARKVESKKPDLAMPAKEMDPSFRRGMSELKDKYGNWFKKSGYTIGEAGFEAATLAALQDEDPVVGAGFAAGTQLVSNLANGGWAQLPDFGSKGVMKVGLKATMSAAAIATFYQIFKELTPAGRDRILESEESGYKKVAATMAIGALTQAAGYGRPTQAQLDNYGIMIDTWHSMRRTSLVGLVTEMENDDSGDIGRIYTQIAQDPTYFSETANRRLNHAFDSEDISSADAIESLMEVDRKFRRKVLALRGNEQEDGRFDKTEQKYDEGYDAFSERFAPVDDVINRMIEE